MFRSRNRNDRGFTLVELMVVIVILGGLIALVGPRVFNALVMGAKAQARNQLSNFGQSIQMYYATNRKLPASLSDLTAENPDTGEPFMDKVPKDPWGNEYDYRKMGNREYVILTFGEDGVEGTEDDLRWPEEGD